MEFLKFAGERYSCRKYSDRPVEPEKQSRVLAAAGIAPTAHNYQPFRIYALRSEKALSEIRQITKMTFKAPVVYILCSVEEEGWVNEFKPSFNAAELDLGIVVSHMWLEASDQGLGAICACWFDIDKVKQAFAIPDGVMPLALFSMGYPADGAHPSKLHYNRRDMKEIVREL